VQVYENDTVIVPV